MKDTLKKSSLVVIISACVLVLVEAPLRWPDLSWFHVNLAIVALNLCLITAFIAICAALSLRMSVGVIAGALALLFLAAVNHFKLLLLNEYLYPWDLFLAKNVYRLMPLLVGQLSWPHYAAVIGAAAVGGTLMIKLPLSRSSLRARLVLVAVSVALLSSVVYYRQLSSFSIAKYYARQNIAWDQKYNYEKNGFFLSFLLNTGNVLVKKPHDYDKDAVLAALGRIARMEDASGDADVRAANIIVVLSEALWDPATLPVEFSREPLENFNRLRKSNVALTLVSPQSGGGTCNVEFELLTGLSMYFVPSGSYPFQQYVTRPLPSLAGYLKERGYSTVAVHPFDKWFWNRSNVMPLLGFERFLSIDDFVNPAKMGMYVSDDAVVSRIIQETEAAEGPIFVFAITMQNHGPYKVPRYLEHNVKVSEHEDLPEATREIIERYTSGAFDADIALKKLVQHYESSKEPTLIVYFGDHLPALGNAYRVLGFASSEKGAEKRFLQKSTPGLIWSNYGRGGSEAVEISMNYLGPLIMEKAGLDLPPHFRLLNGLRREYNVLSRDLVRTKDGQLFLSREFFTRSPGDALLNDYEMLQYDLLFGGQYSLN